MKILLIAFAVLYSMLSISVTLILGMTDKSYYALTVVLAAAFLGAGGVAAILGLILTPKEHPNFKKRHHLWGFVGLALAGIFASGYFLVLKEEGPAVADWVEKGIIPLAIIFLGPLLGNAASSKQKVVGAIVAFCGYGLLAFAITLSSGNPGKGNWRNLFLFPLVGGVGSGLSLLLMGRLSAQKVSRYFTMAGRYLPVGIVCLIVAWTSAKAPGSSGNLTGAVLASVALGGIMINGVLWLSLRIMSFGPNGTHAIGMVFLVVPLLTTSISFAVFGKNTFGATPMLWVAGGVALILAGCALPLFQLPAKK